MNVLVIFLAAILCFFLGYRLYSRYIARCLGEDDRHPTPATEINDGKDYVPTRPSVLFAHHYSTIAGVGPIVGPTLGILYGILPAWLWVVVGAIFFGAVHDFVALFASVRERGSSMAEIARKALGPTGFLLFISFTIILIILVTSAFLSLTAVSLTSITPLAELGMDESQTLLRTRVENGQTCGVIGGIASMSVIVITALAPLLGYLVTRRGIKTWLAFVIAAGIGFFSVWFGFRLPVALEPFHWMIAISVYTLFACQVPVWVILQPRDFVNVQILYAGMLALMTGVVISGLQGATVSYPWTNFAVGSTKMGPVWPFLFITIACGAISGFHALVAGGTSSKQLARETHARRVGYGGMLLESLLAVLVLIAIASSLDYDRYISVVWPDAGKGNPILGFALAMGYLLHSSVGLSLALGSVLGILIVEGFLITTLDSAVRLNRYLFEELWRTVFAKPPRIMMKFWFNSGLSVILMFLLAQTGGWRLIWPVFGATNQLLAALTLVAVAAWLHRAGKRTWYAVAPAVVMMLTTITALTYSLEMTAAKASLHWQLPTGVPVAEIIILVTDAVLLLLAGGVLALSMVKLFSRAAGPQTPVTV